MPSHRALLAVLLAACSSPPAAVDGALAPDAANAPSLPLTGAELVPVRTGPTNDYDAAVFVRARDGAWVVVFDQFPTDMSVLAMALHQAVSVDHRSFSAAVPIDFQLGSVQGGPRAAHLDDTDYLYFQAGSGSATQLYRAAFDGEQLAAATRLVVADPYPGVLAWPSLEPMADGSFALGYNHWDGYATELAFGDGVSFPTRQEIGPGVQGRVATFGDGALAYTYQDGNNPDICYVELSHDRAHFTPPVPIDTGNTHDATPLARLDGGIDLYYIQAGASGFAIMRRAITSTGVMSAPQTVSDPAAGSFTQPHPRRVADGSVLMTFARQVTSSADTDTYCAAVPGDSPRDP